MDEGTNVYTFICPSVVHMLLRGLWIRFGQKEGVMMHPTITAAFWLVEIKGGKMSN